MKRYFVYLTIAGVILLAALPAMSAPNPKTADAIWVVNASARTSGQLRYGGTFSAGWQSSRTQYPWGPGAMLGIGECGTILELVPRAPGRRNVGVFELASS